jgi:cell division FtsZ-interacting protein ZapD
LDAFKFAHDLRLKFKGEFNEEILEMILFEMSKIWRAKEDKIITSLKDKHQKEINLIKQKYQSYGDYNGIVQKKMASRLKGELQKSKKELHSAKKMG